MSTTLASTPSGSTGRRLRLTLRSLVHVHPPPVCAKQPHVGAPLGFTPVTKKTPPMPVARTLKEFVLSPAGRKLPGLNAAGNESAHTNIPFSAAAAALPTAKESNAEAVL